MWALRQKLNGVLFQYETVKVVAIRDWKLGMIYWIFLFGIVCYIFLYAVWWKQGYLSLEDPDGGIRANLMEPDYLSEASMYPYCLQNQPTFGGSSNLDCIFVSGDQAYFPAGVTERPFITTRLRTTSRDPSQLAVNCTPPSSPSCIMRANSNGTTVTRQYLAGIEDYTLFIDHIVYGLQNRFAKRSVEMNGQVWQDGKKLYDLDPNRIGDIFTVRQLLQYAGVSSLDAPSGVAGSSGTLRYDGVQLLMVIEYSNGLSDSTKLLYKYTVVQIPYVETARFEGVSSDLALNRHGIDILVVQTGRIGPFSFPALLTSIVGGVVLLGVATFIVDRLALWILPQKKAYGDAKYELTAELATCSCMSPTEIQMTEMHPDEKK